MIKLAADLHTHTVASGHAYSTVLELASHAKQKGLAMLAVTDHGPSMPGGPHAYHFGNMQVIPSEIDGVEILRGVEANIIDYRGNLDLPEAYLERLDIVLAGFHTYCYPGGTVEENTQAMIRAMQNPVIDIIVHPGNPEFPINIEKVIRAAADTGTFIEINNSSFTVSRRGSKDNCVLIAKAAKRLGAKVAIGSDAHIAMDVGNFDRAMQVVEEAGLTEADVLNASAERVKAYLSRKGKGIVPKEKRYPAV